MDVSSPILDRGDLQALLALETHGQFTRAATALGVSQPALTKRIRQVERRLGGELFVRSAGGTAPTAAGRFLCERARTLLEESARAEGMTREVLRGDRGLLRIGAGLTVLLSGLPEAIRTFRREHPDVHAVVRDMSTQDQINALRHGEIDVGFLRLGDPVKDLQVAPVARDELKLACPSDLARTARLDWRRLSEQPLVLVSRAASPTFHDHVLATCRAARYTPRSVQEVDQLLTALMLVQAGVGLSLVPGACRQLKLPGVRLADLDLPGTGWTIGMAWSRVQAEPPMLKRFRRVAQAVMRGGAQ